MMTIFGLAIGEWVIYIYIYIFQKLHSKCAIFCRHDTSCPATVIQPMLLILVGGITMGGLTVSFTQDEKKVFLPRYTP